MLGAMYRVFLSSTSKDLAAHREAVHRAIDGLDGFDLVKMEDFGARDGTAREVCTRKLQDCDVLVGLVGHCYGSNPPDELTSYTELEYQSAADIGIGRLVFVAPDDFPLPVGPIESEDKQQQQKAFRTQIMTERVIARFDSPERLAIEVTKALANWRKEQETTPRAHANSTKALFFVPFDRPDLIGREQDVERLHDTLQSGATAAVVPALVGQGGIGKTQLAVLYAHDKRSAYPGGVFWLNLADQRRDALLGQMAEYADAIPDVRLGDLGDNEALVRQRLATAWLGHVRQRTDVLVIADNLENRDLLTAPLPGLQNERLLTLGCKLLVTSRQRELPGCTDLPVDFLGPDAALALLLREAGRDPTSAEPASAEQVVRLLGGLPLAIRLAGKILGQNAKLSLGHFAKVLVEHGAIRVLDDRGEPLPDYAGGMKVSLQVLLRQSWDSLPSDRPWLKDVLRAVGCLPESAIIRVALLRELVDLPADPLGLSDPWADALDVLHQWNLLERPDETHVRLHPLVREYVAKQAGPGFVDQLVIRAARNLRSAEFLGQQDAVAFLTLLRELPMLEALADGRR